MRAAHREAYLEGELFRRVRQGFGGACYKLIPTVKGMPDRLIILPGGAMYLVELKTENGSRSAAQIAVHQRLSGLGVEVHTVVGLGGIVQWVRDRGEELTLKRGSGGRPPKVDAQGRILQPPAKPRKQRPTRAKSGQLVQCLTCHMTFQGRVPRGGDSSVLFPRRHGANANPCEGTYKPGRAL